MNDLISRQSAINALNSLPKFSLMGSNECLYGAGVRLKFAIQEIEQLPSAQPAQKTGKWIQCERVNQHRFHPDCPSTYSVFCCTSCLKENDRVEKYCPNCGAKMEEKDG